MKMFLRIVTTIISLIFVICLFANFEKILKNKDFPSIGNYTYIKVTGINMEPTIKHNDLMIINTMFGDLAPNDVIVYKEKEKFYITRFIRADGQNYYIKGDNEKEEKKIIGKQVVAKHFNNLPYLGFVDDLTTTTGGLMILAIMAIVFAFFKHRKTEMF